MKTALARRNEWARQLRLMQEERDRPVEDEPEGKFRTVRGPDTPPSKDSGHLQRGFVGSAIRRPSRRAKT
jgi:hypothetical protein